MTRFQRELSGELGEFWKNDAEKRLDKVRAELAEGKRIFDQRRLRRAVHSFFGARDRTEYPRIPRGEYAKRNGADGRNGLFGRAGSISSRRVRDSH